MEPHRKDARTRWRRHAATACGFALVFTIGAWLGRASVRDEDTPAAVDPVAAGVSAMTRSPPASPATPRPTTSFPALPAPDVPIAAVHDELVARARRGDAAAAMRLAVDLRRCRPWESLHPGVDLDDYPVVKAQLAKLKAFCEGLAPTSTAESDGWLLRAAELGDTDAILCYVTSPDHYALPILSEQWITWARRWRENALPFLVRAYEAGDARALAALAQAHARRSDHELTGPLNSLAPPDPVRSSVYGAMWNRLRDGDPNLSEPESWDQLDEAQSSLASSLFRREWPRFVNAKSTLSSATPCPHSSLFQ